MTGVQTCALPILSFSVRDQKIRLYLFDLGNMKVDDSFNKKDLANFYSNTVIEKLDNLFSFNKARILEQGGYTFDKKHEVAESLANLVLRKNESQ